MNGTFLVTTFIFLFTKNTLIKGSKSKSLNEAIGKSFGHTLFELTFVSVLYYVASFYLKFVLESFFESMFFINFTLLGFYFLSSGLYLLLDKKGLIDAELNKTEEDHPMYINRKHLKENLTRTGLKESFYVGIFYLALTFSLFAIAFIYNLLVEPIFWQ